MRVSKVEIRTHPDPTRTRVFINGEEIENCRAVEFKIEDGQGHPTSIKLEFEGCIVQMNSQVGEVTENGI
jgi:hypothetical protein